MSVAELAGYLASALVFATFYTKTMVPLRIVGISSNLAFLLYAWLAGLVPVFVLHAMLLPLNVWRLMQIRALLQKVRDAAPGGFQIESLLPFMSRRRAKAGEILFRRGDAGGEMFYVVRGDLRLVELGKTLGPGAVLGEISLFAPQGERTATAVCASDVELLAITADEVMRLYFQNPKFGFHVVRLITARLIEDLRLVEAAGDGEGGSQPVPVPWSAAAPPASGGPPAPARRRLPPWLPPVVVAVPLLLACLWQLGPYLRSTVSRDAAVTSWIHPATAPLAGTLVSALPGPGDRVGADGVIARIRDLHSDPSAARHAAGEVARAEQVAAELRAYVETMRGLDGEWQARVAAHAAAFTANLEVMLTSSRLELAQVAERLTLAQAALGRVQRLAGRGNASVSAVDEAQAEVAALALERVERERAIAELEVRREAAGRGVYLTADGADPDWNDRSRDPLRRELARGVADLAAAEAALAEARHAAQVDAEALERTSAGTVTAPPGSLIWRVGAVQGASATAGAEIADWLDCAALMVDVPVSDVEAALLRPGMPAQVVLEGEGAARPATVLLARGSAGAMGLDVLAAVAKGRSAGRAQVLLRLAATPEDVARCPIGQAAFVDFPQVGLIEMLRARLRL